MPGIVDLVSRGPISSQTPQDRHSATVAEGNLALLVLLSSVTAVKHRGERT